MNSDGYKLRISDLFLYCYERDFMDSLNQADGIEAFNSTSRYLDDLLNIGNPYFEGMVNQIYPSELQLNKANISDTEAPFYDLHFSVANGFVSSGVRLYDGPDLKLFILVGWSRSFLSVAWPTGVKLMFFFCSGVSKLFGDDSSGCFS